MNEISCIILAGGKGERMQGYDKGLQLYRNRTLIEHVIERVSLQVDDIVISANRNLAAYRKMGFAVVNDNKSFAGPLAGIASAISHCNHPWVLVVPCDMPTLPDDLVATMWQHTSGASLVAVRTNNSLQLIFLLHRSLVTSINNFLADNQHTVMRWLDSVDVAIVDIDNENYFHNINTLQQLD